MIRSRAPDIGINIYPSQTAGRTKRLGVTSFLPCIQCGSYNDTRTTAWAKQGDGLSVIDGSSPTEFKVGAGCWFCGSLKWRKEKPGKYPDDRELPNPDLRRR